MFEKILSITGRWRRGSLPALARPGNLPVTDQDPTYLEDRLFVRGTTAFVSGLQWTPLEGNPALFLQRAKAEGHQSYCTTPEAAMVGLLRAMPRAPAKTRGPVLAIALVLAEGLSQGGDEVFAFHIAEGRSCFVALRGGIPVPGFDVVGPTDQILERLVTYLDLPQLENVRRVGAHDLLGSMAEPLDWDTLADVVSGRFRLRRILDYRRIAIVLGSVVVVCGLATWGILHKLEADRLAQEEAARAAKDPNRVYEDQIAGKLQQVQGNGQASLRRALGGLRRVPLRVAGWSLESVECSPSLCTARWARTFGSYADFAAALPASAVGAPEYQPGSGGNLPGAHIVTHHLTYDDDADRAGRTVTAAASERLQRASLPTPKALREGFFSALQDLTLIACTVSADEAQLYGAEGVDAGRTSEIKKPVVSGGWSLQGPLWTLDSLQVPPYVSVETLTLDLGKAAEGSPAKDRETEGKAQYKLMGKYYAKGQDY